MAIPDLDFEINFEEDEDSSNQNYWSDGVFYIYNEAVGDYIPQDPQPDPPEAFVLTPEGLIIPA